MEKNETFTGICQGYSFEGAGVVRADGMVVFVPGLLDGEEAEIGITAVRKNMAYGRIVNVLKKSAHRVEPACSVYRLCGGCQLLHMDYPEQARFKEEKVEACFRTNAGMALKPDPILHGQLRQGYRNKVQVPVQVTGSGKVLMGFYQNHTNKIIEFDRCLVQTDLSNAVVASCRTWLEELHCADSFRYVLIKHAHRSHQLMVVLVVRRYPFNNAKELVRRIRETYPAVKSLIAFVSDKEDNVILDRGGKEILLAGQPYIEETLLDHTFRISARSFYQVNPDATGILYQTALAFAGIQKTDTVIDLYCGTGTIGILAAGQAKKVYGIEIVADAVKDARINAGINHVSNIDFITADALQGALRLEKSKIKADVVIVDPPRKGCGKQVLDAIERISPKRLVYVSCDPATLARDCAYLAQEGWQVQKCQPVDMFPGTIHVETVVLMSRVEGK
jgi:23S rRNA (uracil1939-C5)-methyltransferase